MYLLLLPARRLGVGLSSFLRQTSDLRPELFRLLNFWRIDNEEWYKNEYSNFKFITLKKWNKSLKTIKWDVFKRLKECKPDIVLVYSTINDSSYYPSDFDSVENEGTLYSIVRAKATKSDIGVNL